MLYKNYIRYTLIYTYIKYQFFDKKFGDKNETCNR